MFLTSLSNVMCLEIVSSCVFPPVGSKERAFPPPQRSKQLLSHFLRLPGQVPTGNEFIPKLDVGCIDYLNI